MPDFMLNEDQQKIRLSQYLESHYGFPLPDENVNISKPDESGAREFTFERKGKPYKFSVAGLGSIQRLFKKG